VLTLNFGNIGLDFQYETGGLPIIAEAANFKNTDLRPNQSVLVLSLKIN
jgi:hypothetical protein